MTAVGPAAATAARVLDEVERAVVGKRDTLELILAGVLAGGHVLIEDLPGVGKTLMARSFAAVLGLGFRRLQFTPDLIPADITGSYLYDQQKGAFSFVEGPVFTHFLLADELNRTPPKTQAALLEAMEEAQVSVEGTTHPLPRPFVVLATDNPIEYEGTYPLPEAQLDRFLLRTRLGYLEPELERAMLDRRLRTGAEPVVLQAVTDPDGVLGMRAAVEEVEVTADLRDYVVRLVTALRADPQLAVGASARATLALTQVARARALLAGRDFLVPDDVKGVAVPVLAHRLVPRMELWVRQASTEDRVRKALAEIPTPPTRGEP